MGLMYRMSRTLDVQALSHNEVIVSEAVLRTRCRIFDSANAAVTVVLWRV